ncbi:MAG: CotH kinase family protein [Flavobacteriales bacterium]|nr:CotH kinase family protein [Flavobacteriales bacterium]
MGKVNDRLGRAVMLMALLLQLPSSMAQTFSGAVGTILDDGSHNHYLAQVSGVVPAVMDTNYGLETVCITLTHTWTDDLVISLIAPDGSEFLLAGRNGGDGDNYTATCFNQDAAVPIDNVGAPFTGTFRPEGAMAMVNNGQDPNGTWTLHIWDSYPWADTGDLLSWSVTFGDQPATPFPFSATVLPLVVVNTHGGLIPDDPKVMVGMRIIRNADGAPNRPTDPGNIYDGLAGMETRGNSSNGMPKRSYNFETRNADSTNRDVVLLDMPLDNDWCLIANYSDKTLMRNWYSYHLFRKMGHWAPRMEFCELMVDGEYQGIYLLGERIKKGPDRVTIATMTTSDVEGAELTGGYIFKVDWVDNGDVVWQSQFPAVNASEGLRFVLDYPKPENLQPQQLDYIRAYVDSFEQAMDSPDFSDTLSGFRNFISQGSFVDYIILTEFTKNTDGYRLSTFLHKVKNGKIKAGPPWDYDLSWGNADYMNGYYPGGWDFETQSDLTDQCPFWWSRFFEDTVFMDRVRCRWQELREHAFHPDTIKAEIDSLAELLGPAIGTNFTKWPILGTYVWPNPSPIPDDYPGEIAKLKDWADFRITWLDEHWPGTCAEVVNSVGDAGAMGRGLSLYPNPSNGVFRVAVPQGDNTGTLVVSTMDGSMVMRQGHAGTAAIEVNLGALGAGLYVVTWQTATGLYRAKANVTGWR